MSLALLIPTVVCFATALFLFPVMAARALAELIQRAEDAGWRAITSLVLINTGLACILYRQAVHYRYAKVLGSLWREWWGSF